LKNKALLGQASCHRFPRSNFSSRPCTCCKLCS